ncbi:hypothetical protein ACFFRR_001662 [Megaselia abdita]
MYEEHGNHPLICGKFNNVGMEEIEKKMQSLILEKIAYILSCYPFNSIVLCPPKNTELMTTWINRRQAEDFILHHHHRRGRRFNDLLSSGPTTKIRYFSSCCYIFLFFTVERKEIPLGSKKERMKERKLRQTINLS